MDFDANVHLAPNIYHDRHFGCQAVKILPGEYFVTTKDQLIVTVLGSCVAACIYDADRQIGGMNHFLLPNDGQASQGIANESARYGAYAMELLINHLLKLGARKSHLEAKVFGGGNVLQGITHTNIGERNAEFVIEFLANEGIPLLAKDLLDRFPRKVYYFPATSKVMVKKLKNMHNTTIIDRESEYRMRMRSAPKSGEVDLF
ncbi:chemoreceptor glutamine deamidase CheD [Gilvimarinus sp. SDUM040013]|uniref:Probable chemoreceptor glutamine deamidase CheD n=1 Tax=Gilvimarinus gilvus TaxID=3058038 RepID=A0ABU4RTH3_9GAMM|nr:chemoreceptor glutamine deamidase CheD [Gilvimarinus sp. SDUM040013]MDO3388419.1 chemoreceptor glutamine deamidase CheD [Gilvimarinus sp. SDUM040013]MDX6847969.1 chemoreceptor glutamine deamidase CheD [Gilvimarinus sp. SDUM040013]